MMLSWWCNSSLQLQAIKGSKLFLQNLNLFSLEENLSALLIRARLDLMLLHLLPLNWTVDYFKSCVWGIMGLFTHLMQLKAFSAFIFRKWKIERQLYGRFLNFLRGIFLWSKRRRLLILSLLLSWILKISLKNFWLLQSQNAKPLIQLISIQFLSSSKEFHSFKHFCILLIDTVLYINLAFMKTVPNLVDISSSHII